MAERLPNAERPNAAKVRLAVAASWVVLFASFGLSAATWVALARLAGFDGWIGPFGAHWVPLPWLMPITVDGYVVVALALWMSSADERVRAFARKNTYTAALVGVAAQSAYHSLTVWSTTNTGWRAALAAVVGALPPAGAAVSVHMRALARRRQEQAGRTLVGHGSPVAVRQVRQSPADTRPNERPAPKDAPNTDGVVRPITSARHATPNARKANAKANGDVAANLAAIKEAFPAWAANTPSARAIATLLGVATSTGFSYQQRLTAERVGDAVPINGREVHA